jgi:RNA polymerase primary sigma factor
VKEVRSAARAVTSLDKPVGSEGDSTFADLIAGESAEPSEEVHVSLAESAVRSAVETLPERERAVVKLRFGMNGDKDPQSLEQIGKQLGLTRERVRQIETQALNRLAERREVAALGEHAA